MKKTIKILVLTLGIGIISISCCNKADQTQTCGEECACAAETKTEMEQQSAAFLYESELEWQTPVVGLQRQIMGYNDNLMLVKIDFEAGCDGGGQHAHPHTQSSVVVSGVFEVTIDGVTQTLKAGDGFYVAPNLMHGAVCIEAGTLIDAFSPVRADFLK